MPSISLQRKHVAPFASAAIELTVNRVTQNNPWDKDLLTVGASTSSGWLMGAGVVTVGKAMGYGEAYSLNRLSKSARSSRSSASRSTLPKAPPSSTRRPASSAKW